MPTSDQSIKWVENLADQERSIAEQGRGELDLCATREEVLSVATSVFLREIFHQFEYLLKIFNHRVADSVLQVKVTRDEKAFSLSRNGTRVLFTSQSPGVVQVNCDRMVSLNDSLATSPSVLFSGLVEAHFESFHEVEWVFLGTKVSAEHVARHYLTEFLQISRKTNA